MADPARIAGCLPELWHVQMTKNGSFVGYYQFFHPNKSAAEKEAARLRDELPEFGEVHVCRYVLAEDGASRPDNSKCPICEYNFHCTTCARLAEKDNG